MQALKKQGALFLSIFLILSLFFFLPVPARAEDSAETVRVGFFAFDGYHMLDENGNRCGYGYDFLRMAARYINVNFEYVGYDKSWEDMQQMLRDGEIDLLTSAQKTPDREQNFAYSLPIGTSSGILTVSSDNRTIIQGNYATYDGMRVGLLKDNTRNDDFARLAADRGFTYTPVYYSMVQDMADDLQSGKLDAIVSSSLRRTNHERIIEEFATSDFYAVVRKEDTELLDTINYAIEQMNAVEGDWQNALTNKYYTHFENRSLDFTPEEQALIDEYADGKKKLVVTCSTDRAPYSYVEDGELRGILPDYFRQIADYAGFEYEFMLPSSREELYEWQLSGTADIFIDSRLPSEQRAEDLGFATTTPYITMKLAMVTRRDFNGVVKKISVAEEQGTYGIEENLATDAERVAMPTREEAMQAVLNGQVDATFVYLYTAQEFVNRDERGLLTYTALENPSYQYQMVVSSNVNHAWAGILTKCIYAQSDSAIDELAAQYTSYKARNISLYTLFRLYPFVFVVTAFIVVLAAVLVVRLRAGKRLMAYEQKKAAEMEQLAQQAQAANISKSRFLFNMSHDIRTPMNAIIGFTDLALKDGDVSSKTQEYLEKIRISSAHLLDIINDVLEMSSIENSRIELKEEPCSLPELVEDVTTVILGASRTKEQNLRFDISQISHPDILCDHLRLKEILVNLLSNAVKFTPDHGSIAFSILEKPGTTPDTGIYEIRVQDNGIGMPPEFLARVFEPFEREHSSTVSGIAGTGLGLSITKHFVELMGGTIHADSEQGKGSTFVVTLPLKFDTENHPAVCADAGTPAVLPSFAGRRLLLVEDNELNREIEATILEDAGFYVEYAENGAIAVDKVSHAQPGYYDAILMDIQMPVMDGYEATRRIRGLKDPQLAGIPILAVSANAFAEDVDASLKAGMNGHVAKPISVDALMTLLAKFLSA